MINCEKRKQEGKKCFKEINPEFHPGVFFGEGWKYEESMMACYFCELEEGGHPLNEQEEI